MAEAFHYAPYAGAKPSFSMALDPLDPARWIEPDVMLASHLALKDRVLADHADLAVRAEPDTASSQAEIRDALAAYLLTHHPSMYARHGETVHILPADRRITLDDATTSPLVTAARLIQDDLVLMRNGKTGWRLAAAVLTAPSTWSLAEKFGQNLDAIHTRVPGYVGRMAETMARIFDNLAPDKPLWRMNWSLYDDDVLFHPEIRSKPKRWSGADGRFGEQAFIRVERQTLRRMPGSGDILFTIRIYVDPVAAFKTHPRGPELAEALAQRLAGLNEDQLRYKGLLADRDRVIAALNALTA